jgi:Rrf2 family iron-sulfur cluster assembly transcriptional regulator
MSFGNKGQALLRLSVWEYIILMIYSETVKYALLALAYLALNRDRLVKVKEIAEAQNIPKPFLSKIFHKLVKERVLRSYKGPNGGFTFIIPPEKITIYDVIRYLRLF